MNQVHSLLVEKYRPQTIDEYICSDSLRKTVDSYIKNKDIPHLLLHGGAGSGKTTLAKLLVNAIECDYIYINASDKNGIDAVRDEITNFVSTIGFSDLKVVILDEMDGFSAQGQAALRNVMETFSAHSRFIMTCNYVEKVIDPIQSRCQVFHIVPPSKTDVGKRVLHILTTENISYQKDDVISIINSNYPDIRRIINSIHKNTIDGNLVLDDASEIEANYMEHVVTVLKSAHDGSIDPKSAFDSIRQHIADSGVRDFTALYTHLFDRIDEYGKGKLAPIIISLADGSYRSSLVVDKEITIMATMVGILEILYSN